MFWGFGVFWDALGFVCVLCFWGVLGFGVLGVFGVSGFGVFWVFGYLGVLSVWRFCGVWGLRLRG